MKKLLFVFAVIALMLSCQSKGNKAEVDSASVVDSVTVTPDSTIVTETRTYEGVLPAADCEGIRYVLTIQNQENSGDGTYTLNMTYIGTNNGKDVTFAEKGKRFTQRGIPGNPNAIVYQLVPNGGGEKINFLVDSDTTLTMLNNEFKKAMSNFNYTVTLVK